MKALIDGDVIVYASGFASDAAAKRAKLAEFGDNKEKLASFIELNGPLHEPLDYCLHGVNEKIGAVLKAAEADEHQILISHPVNYREQIYEPYKANRNVLHKPFWYEEIHEHLLRMGAVYSKEGDEADDALGIWHTASPDDTIICTIDKDLDQIPGRHYNWGPKRWEEGVYTISPLEGNQFFYQQLLTGDSTDNIPGMFKQLGKKATKKYLEPLEDMHDPREMYEYVLSVYGGDAEFIHLIAQLLWIKRTDERWEAP